VRPEGANHQWRKNPPGELSIDPVADERFVRLRLLAQSTLVIAGTLSNATSIVRIRRRDAGKEGNDE